ncbi:MAG: hypothetical protein HPY55_01260 [Firmicutes bacterium]|nr:hypothetical protein [Bacillota bacterium]
MISGAVLASGEGQTLVGRRREVAKFLYSIGKASDPVSFQAFVFVAQRGNALSSEYEFDFSRNLPLSVDLTWDLEGLMHDGIIIDERRGNAILVRDDLGKTLDRVESPLVERLATTDPPAVLTLARLIWLTQDRGIPLDEAGRLLVEKGMIRPECVHAAEELYKAYFQLQAPCRD